WIARLLVRQIDIEADRGRLTGIGAFIEGLHQTGPTAADYGKAGIGQAAGDFFAELVIRVIRRRSRRAEHAHRWFDLRQPLEAFDKLGDDLEDLPRFAAER